MKKIFFGLTFIMALCFIGFVTCENDPGENNSGGNVVIPGDTWIGPRTIEALFEKLLPLVGDGDIGAADVYLRIYSYFKSEELWYIIIDQNLAGPAQNFSIADAASLYLTAGFLPTQGWTWGGNVPQSKNIALLDSFFHEQFRFYEIPPRKLTIADMPDGTPVSWWNSFGLNRHDYRLLLNNPIIICWKLLWQKYRSR